MDQAHKRLSVCIAFYSFDCIIMCLSMYFITFDARNVFLKCVPSTPWKTRGRIKALPLRHHNVYHCVAAIHGDGAMHELEDCVTWIALRANTILKFVLCANAAMQVTQCSNSWIAALRGLGQCRGTHCDGAMRESSAPGQSKKWRNGSGFMRPRKTINVSHNKNNRSVPDPKIFGWKMKFAES